MIDYKVTITSDCDVCGVELEENEEHIFCDKCRDYEISESQIKDYMKSAVRSFWLNDKYNCVGFKSKEEKETFFRGFRDGISDVLFWLCDDLGIMDFFENEIGHSLEHLKEPGQGRLPDIAYSEDHEKEVAKELEESIKQRIENKK